MTRPTYAKSSIAFAVLRKQQQEEQKQKNREGRDLGSKTTCNAFLVGFWSCYSRIKDTRRGLIVKMK